VTAQMCRSRSLLVRRPGRIARVTDGLRFTYRPDSDGEDFRRLEVEVQHEGFAGLSDCHVTRRALMTFAQQLGTYPLPEPPPLLVGGYGEPEIDDVAVSLRATQITPHGQVGIEIQLRDPDAIGLAEREVRLTMCTTYARLDAFHRQWLDVLRERGDETVELGAERLA
jgi:hypothetical protein